MLWRVDTSASEITVPTDPFDPNTWAQPQNHEFRLYLDDNAFEYVVLDEVDYHHFVQWRWLVNKPHPARVGKKRYATRTGPREGTYRPKYYLHVEIMKRTGIQPPSPNHTLVDHRDGDEFNCRRSNLRWATVVLNNRNRFGCLAGALLDVCDS